MIDIKWNKLLIRQIKRQFGSVENLPSDLQSLFQEINKTYESFEDDTKLLQNSIEISSQELRDAFQKQKRNAEAQKETIDKIHQAIQALKPGEKNIYTGNQTEGDSSSLVDSLIRLIEEHNLMEGQLKESEKLQRSLLENVTVGIVIIDPETRMIERANPFAAELIGTSVEKIEGVPCNRYLCGPNQEICPMCDLGQEVADSHNTIRRADGSIIPVLKTVKRIKIRGKEKLLESFVDISVQKEAEAALQNERTLFRTIIDLIPDGVYVKDIHGKKILANPTEVYFSRKDSEAQIIGKTDWQLLLESEAMKSMEQDRYVLETGNPVLNIDGQLVDRDGDFHWVLCSKVALRDANGIIIGLVGVTHDITDLKKTEETLLLAKEEADVASRIKSEFLANMSHEIRTPLNGVIGFTDLLLKTPLNKIQQQYAENANTSGQGLLGIINDILDFSKIEAGKMELDMLKTDIQELAGQSTDIVKYHASQKGLELLLNIQSDIPRFGITDPIRVKQILVNLLGNAVKFTHCGEVELQVSFDKINDKRGKFHFMVRDTGIGISLDQQKQLFKAFSQADTSTTRKFGGTGLGLTISGMLAEKMGSKIEIESQPGNGSKFFFTLETEYQTEKQPGFEKLSEISRVLIIDDNVNSRNILHSLFTSWSVESIGVDNAMDIRNLLENEKKFDLILVDYHMPEYNGLETIRMIREELKLTPEKQPIFLLHNSSDEIHIHEESKKLGVLFAIAKPVKSAELLCFLKSICHQQKEDFDSVKLKVPQPAADFSADKFPVILLAEDVLMNRILATTLIKQMVPNVTVMDAKSGREASDLAVRINPDLILMDVQMPELSGIEATLEIRNFEREKGSRVPIVALTAGAIKGEKERCLEAGMDDFLTKPVDREALLGILKKYLS